MAWTVEILLSMPLDVSPETPPHGGAGQAKASFWVVAKNLQGGSADKA
jgi:hypothetical protein